MIHFHGICHGEIDLMYVGGFLKFGKLDFGSLKKANFRGLMTKIGTYNPILVCRNNLWPIFMDYTMEILASRPHRFHRLSNGKVCFKNSKAQSSS